MVGMVVLRYDRYRASRHGIGGKTMSIVLCAHETDKQIPRFHRARIVRDPQNLCLCARLNARLIQTTA
jgi:hypothetical protein